MAQFSEKPLVCGRLFFSAPMSSSKSLSTMILGPTMARSHLVSREGVTILDSILSPWVVNSFPTQGDYGIDGDVKLADLPPGKLNARVLPVTFQYQLKSTTSQIRTPPTLAVKSSHLEFWIAHNVPTAIFLVQVLKTHRGVVYAKLIDSTFVADLQKRRPKWPKQKTVSIWFLTSDRIRRNGKERFALSIRKWTPWLRRDAV